MWAPGGRIGAVTTNYTATVLVADNSADTDDVLDALVGHSPVWSARELGRADVTLSVDAETLTAAAARVVELVEAATGSSALRVEVTTSAEFDREHGFDPDES